MFTYRHVIVILLTCPNYPLLQTGKDRKMLLKVDEHKCVCRAGVEQGASCWRSTGSSLVASYILFDDCHMRIQRSINRGGDYMNRKRFYSVLLQGTIDDRGRFLDISVGTPWEVHDALILHYFNFHST